jgi:predicted N-acetyltransferase YhbS
LSDVSIREAAASDAPGIRRLFSRVFGAELTAEEFSWKFLQNPDGFFGVVAERGGEILGNYAGWGTRLSFDGESRLCYSVGDVATDPSIRGVGGRAGVYRRMVEKFYADAAARGIPFCFGFPNERALEISNRLAHTRTQFRVREIHVPCDAFRPSPRDVGRGDSVGEAYDALWEDASRRIGWGAVRDRARVNWRFHARPNRYYRMIWLPEAGAMRAWAVLSVTGERALLADHVAASEEDLAEIFDAAGAEARAMGAASLVFWESPGGPARGLLARLPGERRDAGFALSARILDEGASRGFAENVALTPALYDVV